MVHVPWRNCCVYWVVGLLVVFRAVNIHFRSGSEVVDMTIKTKTSFNNSSTLDNNARSCSLKLYIYPPTNKILLNDPGYPASKKGDLLLEDHYLESEIFRTYFSNVRNCTVTDPNEANTFLVPHASAAHLFNTHNFDREAFVKYYRKALKPFLEHIRHDMPYFNESLPRIDEDSSLAHSKDRLSSNHFFLSVFDNGPFCDENHHASEEPVFSDRIWMEVVAPMRQIGYYNQFHQVISQSRQCVRRTRCFEEDADIALPMWDRGALGDGKDEDRVIHLAAEMCSASSLLFEDNKKVPSDCLPWLQYLQKRASYVTKVFFFKGTVTKGKQCLPGIRPLLKDYCTQNVRDDCHFIDSQEASNNISTGMESAIFALCPAGFACWSARFYDAWNHMTIPIRLTDDIVEPFSSVIPGGEDVYRSMMVSLPARSKEELRNRSTWSLEAMNVTQRLDSLAASALEWREACSHLGIPTVCLTHSISSRLMAVIKHRHWFSWSHTKAEEGAFTLLESEIQNRLNLL